MLKINSTLLKNICNINSPSHDEQPMISFIINYCYNVVGIFFEIDSKNNIFITKNTTNPESYPCLVAHMDEVHKHKNNREVLIKNGYIWSRYISSKTQCGIGADDKFGIYVALHLLNELSDLKICFTTAEEMGGIGAEEASLNIEFFENVRYLIQADRRGNSDIITWTNGLSITSSEFLEDISNLLQKYNYKEESGTFTDVGILKENINVSAINVSCGYYREHTSKEYGKLSELQTCLNLIYEIINTTHKVYTHVSALDYDKLNSYHTYIAYPCNTCTNNNCMNCDIFHSFEQDW